MDNGQIVSTLEVFTPQMRQSIVEAWYGKLKRWKHGVVRQVPGGVGVFLRGNVLRDFIPSEVIAEYLVSIGKRED